MAVDIRHYTATIPAGTPLLAPVTVALAMPVRVVRQINWLVPPGPMGVFGWQIAQGGVKVFPTDSDNYITVDGKDGTWIVTDASDSGQWQVIGYNTGAFSHSVKLEFHCDLPERPKTLALSLPAWELYPGGPLDKAGPPLHGAA